MKEKKKGVHMAFYFMTVPRAVLFFMFHTFPFLQGIFYSFTDWKGYGGWSFVGFRNYLHILVDKDVVSAYLFTFKFALFATIFVNLFSLLLACALDAKIKFKNTIKAIYFLPYMLGNLIIGFIFNFIFANILPDIGKVLDIEAISVNILGTKNAWLGVLLSKPEQQTLQLSQYVFQGQFSTQYNLAFASYILVLIPVLVIYILFQKWIISGITTGYVKQ